MGEVVQLHRTGQTQFQFAWPPEQHPCRFPDGRISHRAYVTRDTVLHCERCGVEIDENKKEIAHG